MTEHNFKLCIICHQTLAMSVCIPKDNHKPIYVIALDDMAMQVTKTFMLSLNSIQEYN